ncbi:hypothetical protein TNCT_28461 [Trichonephila clavata]|uniref:Uncharacterized protein n=1 Tax=Trichonephila clavata TaxID=2740835 RepID=A0A8X6HGR2_TRICU|nr:hypothetical protein TNCT_28461 [Trichonephila clavata]
MPRKKRRGNNEPPSPTRSHQKLTFGSNAPNLPHSANSQPQPPNPDPPPHRPLNPNLSQVKIPHLIFLNNSKTQPFKTPLSSLNSLLQ